MRYPFLRLVFPSFLAVMIIAGFYIGRYVSPMNIPMIGIVYFLLISILIIVLSVKKCIRDKKGLFYVLLGIFVIHAVYFILLYVYSKPYRDGLEKDLYYLWATCLSWLINSLWIWACLPKRWAILEKPLLSKLFITNFFVFIVIMFMAPNYSDYTDRTYISEGLAIAMNAKLSSAEFYKEHQKFPENNQEVGLSEANKIVGQSVKAVEILPKGKIKITYNNKLADNAFIILGAILDDKDKITWQCREADLLEMKMIPANCRGQLEEFNAQSNVDHL